MPDVAARRILVDARVGWGSGIGRYIENVVPRVAAKLPDTAFDVLVGDAHAERAGEHFAPAGNIRVVPTAVRPFSPAEQVALSRYAGRHALTWFTNYWVPLGWRGRFVTTVHDVIHLCPELFPASAAKRWASRAAFGKVRRRAALVLFDSRFTRDEFHRLVGRPRRGVVVPLGADHFPAGNPVSSAARDRRLLVVAAFKQHKNFATVLDAWKSARIADHWQLTIVAPGETLRSSVDVAALTAGLRNVELRRGVTDAELRDLYSRTAVSLTPSLYEGFGLPLLEAFAGGAFGISSTAGAQVEIADGADVAFVNGRDVEGWVAAIERACARFDDAGFDAGGVARRNMAHAAAFRWDDTANATAAALHEVLSPATYPSSTGRHSDHV